jgi:hypothetical protein
MSAREIRFPKGKYFDFTILFGLLYALDLYVYIGYKSIMSQSVKNDVINYEMTGMILLLMLFVLALFTRRNYLVSLRKLFWIGLAVQCFLGLATPFFLSNTFILGLLRFVGAIVVSLNFCTYLSVVGQSIGRKRRTWTVSIIFSMGFSGPFFVNFIDKFMKNNLPLYLIFPTLVSIFAYYIMRKHGENDVFTVQSKPEKGEIDDDSSIEISKNIRNIVVKGNFWRALYILLICGLFVQFSVRYLLEHTEIFTTNIDPQRMYMLRYLGSAFGVITLCWFSVRSSKIFINVGVFRVRLGERKIMYQIAAIFGLLSLYGYSMLHQLEAPLAYIVPFLLGISNAVWCIIFLQSLESLGRRTQPILVFLLPILLRIFWDIFHYNNLKGLIGNDANLKQTIIFIGVCIWIVGILTSILWVDNYEGGNRLDAYNDNFVRGFSTAIMDSDVRKKLATIDPQIVSSDNVKPYIEEVSALVKDRLEEVFDTTLYYYNFTFLKEGEETFMSKVKVNKNAIVDLRKVNENTIKSLFKWLRVILSSKNYNGLASYSFEQGYEGMVLAGRKDMIAPQLQAAYNAENYKVFDLSAIKLPDEQKIIDFWQTLGAFKKDNDFKDENKIEAVKAAFRPIYKDFVFEKNKDKKDDNFPEPIRRLLTLRAIGAWCYPKGEYFIYVLTPKVGVRHKLKTSMLLATSSPIPVEKLSEIRDLLDNIMLQKAFSMSLDAEWKAISFQQSHALKTTFGYLNNSLNAISEVRLDKVLHRNRLDEVQSIIHTMDNVNTFNLEMMRFENNPDTKSAYIIPEKEGVSLEKTIKRVIKEIQHAVSHLRTTEDGHSDNLRDLLADMHEKNANISVNSQVKIKVIKVGFRILITEILKNAFTHTDCHKPKVEIVWADYDDDFFSLSFSNNDGIEQEALDYINDKHNNTVGKIGIATIKRILKFKQFNQSKIDKLPKCQWQMKVKTQENPYLLTTLTLLIPKTDVYYV